MGGKGYAYGTVTRGSEGLNGGINGGRDSEVAASDGCVVHICGSEG